jgi:hypothetical protein
LWRKINFKLGEEEAFLESESLLGDGENYPPVAPCLVVGDKLMDFIFCLDVRLPKQLNQSRLSKHLLIIKSFS